ncbi:DoxX family protein [Serinibacter salmoneus]|uniref:Putative membrane protein n=1 Tax=Serinibacter salmoneus TaxID=556530 RepID=A0A2A9D3I6_9MICO|nr:DoxX family protein [Serinibacter salmoneus]PFG21224.1 putative membrane protein [Serinibacter salmoneus]
MTHGAPASHLPWSVVAPFAVSGVIHLVRPGLFEPIIPAPLRPWARELVVASGAAELACAAGLVHPRTRRLAGRASAALLVAVWPANAQMSLDLARLARARRDQASVLALVASLARLPLQIPLIRAALRAH